MIRQQKVTYSKYVHIDGFTVKVKTGSRSYKCEGAKVGRSKSGKIAAVQAKLESIESEFMAIATKENRRVKQRDARRAKRRK